MEVRLLVLKVASCRIFVAGCGANVRNCCSLLGLACFSFAQNKMVEALSKEQSARLLKHIVRCYLRLTDHPRARGTLCRIIPDQLKDNTFASCLKEDSTTRRWLRQLLQNLGVKSSFSSLVPIKAQPSRQKHSL